MQKFSRVTARAAAGIVGLGLGLSVFGGVANAAPPKPPKPPLGQQIGGEIRDLQRDLGKGLRGFQRGLGHELRDFQRDLGQDLCEGGVKSACRR